MANGKIRFGKQSGGELALVFPDGVDNTEVVFPESGILATEQYVDDSAEPTWVANDTRAKTALNASGTAPIFACRAWVNFNGTGTVAIRASGNISSITDNGNGNYTVNFTTAMSDTQYSVIGTSSTYAPQSATTTLEDNSSLVARTVSAVRVTSVLVSTTSNRTLADADFISVEISR